MITYLNSERNFGFFRFPRDVEGNFISPIYINQKKMRDMFSLTDKEINLILKRKKPVVFEAFRIPQFGLEFIGISNNEINDLGRKFVREFNKKFKEKEGEVKSKIVSKPNYLLILQSILDRQEEDIKKMSLVTDNIVYE